MTTVLLLVLVVTVIVYLQSILRVLRQIATSLRQTTREMQQMHRDLRENSSTEPNERKDGHIVNLEVLRGPIEEVREEVAATRAWLIERNTEMRRVKASELLAAVRKGDEGAIESIATNREVLNLALFLAVQRGTPEDVKALLGYGAEANSKNSQGETPLMWAAARGHPEIAKILIGAGVDVNSRDSLGRTALMSAAVRGRDVIARVLIDAGAQVDQTSNHGTTVLHEAIRYWGPNDLDPTGRLALIELLVEKGASASMNAEDVVGHTPLMAAARGGRSDIVEKLCALGANPNGANSKGDTALISAVGDFFWGAPRASPEAVKVLVRNGADVNLSNKDGETPLLVAAKNQEPEGIQVLLDSGADVNAKDSQGRSALMLLLEQQPFRPFREPLDSGRLLSLTRLLLARGADPNGVNVNGGTVLNTAVFRGDLSVVRELLNAGADVNASETLAVAAAAGHLTIVQELLNAGADVNLVGDSHGTALIAAAEKGHLTIVQELLNAGADVNLVGDPRGTALTVAAEEGHLPIVQILLARGADPRITSKRSQNALDVVEAKRSEIETEKNEGLLAGWDKDDYQQYEARLKQLETIERELRRALHAASVLPPEST